MKTLIQHLSAKTFFVRLFFRSRKNSRGSQKNDDDPRLTIQLTIRNFYTETFEMHLLDE
jgi:hypothetical protein